VKGERRDVAGGVRSGRVQLKIKLISESVYLVPFSVRGLVLLWDALPQGADNSDHLLVRLRAIHVRIQIKVPFRLGKVGAGALKSRCNVNAAMLRAAFDNRDESTGVRSREGVLLRSLSLSSSGNWNQSWSWTYGGYYHTGAAQSRSGTIYGYSKSHSKSGRKEVSKSRSRRTG
jgi:hypothetical protein